MTTLSAHHAKIVTRACRIIETSENPPALAHLARTVGMSPFHFQRVFTAATGLSPKAYAAAHRAKKIRAALPRTSSVTRAIYQAGYNSNARFYANSNQTLGMTPGNFRRGGADTIIRFALGQCSLGAILVAASDKGVCAIFLGDDPNALTRTLQDRFPNAQLIGGNRTFERLVAQVVGLVENPRQGVHLPLDIRGTAFQQKVWRTLTKIPLGQIPPPTPKSPNASASPPPSAPSPGPAPTTRSPSSFPATASSAPTAPSPATAGASPANAPS